MNSQQFVIWLKGFAAAAGEFTLTPKQWDDLTDELNKVDDTPYVSDNFTIGPDGAYERDPNQFPMGGILQDHNTFRKNKYSGPIDVPMFNPFGTPNGTRGPETPTGTTITTTPGTGYITIANPYVASFGDISTSTSTSLPSGSTISYTTSNEKTLLND